MKLAERCRAEFESRDKSRGATYFRDGLASLTSIGNNFLLAEVEGSYGNAYRVAIYWEDARNGFLDVECECPRFADGWLCKHLWATILEFDARGESGRVPGRNALEVLEVHGELLDSSRLQPTKSISAAAVAKSSNKTRAKSAKQKTGKNQVPNWQRSLSILGQLRAVSNIGIPTESQWDQLFPQKHREAWYALDVGQCVARQQFVLQLFERVEKKDGELGKFKQLRLDDQEIATFTDSEDRALLSYLIEFPEEINYGYRNNYRYNGYSSSKIIGCELPVVTYEHLLPRLAATGRFVWQLDSSLPMEEANPLAWDDAAPWQVQLELLADDKKKQWTLAGSYVRGKEIRPLTDGVMPTPTGLLLMDDKLARLDAPDETYQWLVLLLESPHPIEIPYRDREAFLRQLWAAPTLPPLNLPANLQWEEVQAVPEPCLKIHAPDKNFERTQRKLGAELSFRYGEQEVSRTNRQSGFVEVEKDSKARVLVRDQEAESVRITELAELGVGKNAGGYPRLPGELELPRSQLSGIVEALVANGWHVEAEGKLFRSPGNFNINVQSNIDWFEMEATLDFDGTQATLPELLTAVRQGARYVELGDGSRGMLPEQWLDRYARLAELGDSEGETVRFKPSQALLLDTMLAEQDNLRLDQKFRNFRERLRSFDGVKPKDAPKTFQGELRDYQQAGLGWFHFLQSLGLGGCLADDMGLGKTVQVLALFEQRRKRRLKKNETRRPSLVVVPKSLIFNWIDEAERFTPKLRAADYTGLDRRERVGNFDQYHMIVTTYGTLRRDIEIFKNVQFDYAVLDESQAIKNDQSQSAKACRLLQADHRLALTGTPIENHLGELWSLFEFLNPGMLGHSRAFASLCKSSQPGENESLEALSRAVAPFMLRRTKQQVLKELPEKTEQTLYCDLLPKDRKAYNELRNFYRDKLAKKIDQKGLKQSKIHVLEALLRLRQAACHVGLVDKKKASQSSAKLDTLLQQVREVVAEGHKVLVFSQFTSLLAIVRTQLDKEGIVYEYLDGRTRKRKDKITRFQTDETCPLFLISLKAGGSGLNLTAAEYVFILDPWWNPAVEAQAIDRTHRIGQTQQVFAYRIIARNTVEEKVLELQKSKRDLANAIITADESLIRNLTAEDLQLILS